MMFSSTGDTEAYRKTKTKVEEPKEKKKKIRTSRVKSDGSSARSLVLREIDYQDAGMGWDAVATGGEDVDVRLGKLSWARVLPF